MTDSNGQPWDEHADPVMAEARWVLGEVPDLPPGFADRRERTEVTGGSGKTIREWLERPLRGARGDVSDGTA